MHDKCIDKDQICSSCIQPCFFAHECNPHDINVTQHVAHVRHKIASTNFLQCIQKVHRPHTISLQASNPVSIHEFLPSSWGAGCCGMWATGDLSPIRQQHDKYHSNDDNETTCSSESVSHSLREDDSHSETSSDSTEGNSHSENNNSLYSQFYDDLSEYLGIEPEDRQSKSRKHKLPTAVAGFSSVRYNVTDANN
jgi:cytoskeletal protein RodZ